MIYVLIFPEFKSDIAESIDRFRSRYEPDRARLVRPHITLIFGLRNVEPTDFIPFCGRIAEQETCAEIELPGSESIFDPYEKAYKLCLTVGAGSDRLCQLHARLYDGPHRSELDTSIPFRPHMTIATHQDRSRIEALDAGAIGPFPLLGRISAFEVVERTEKSLVSLGTFPL